MNLLDLIANGGTDLANALGVTPPDTPDVTDAAKKGSIYGVRGIRNNNPGNLQTNIHWDGMVPGNDSRFATFSSPQYGIQAMTQNLIAKPKLHGLTTINQIIGDPTWGWAPPNENNSAAYAKFVAGQLGISPNTQLPMSFFQNPVTMQKLAGAIIQKENGQNPYTPQQMAAGVSAGLGSVWHRPFPTVQPGNMPGVVGGGNLPAPTQMVQPQPMGGINGMIQNKVAPMVNNVLNTVTGHNTGINQAVGAPFKQGVDDVNNLGAEAVQSAMDTFKGQDTWPNNFLSGVIGGQIQGINNSLTNAITPIVQPAYQAEQNGMNSVIGGINKGLGGIAQTLSSADQKGHQMAQQMLQTNAQAAQAAKQKAGALANAAANAVSGQAQAAQQAMPAGAAPGGTPGSGNVQMPQPQQAGAAAPDGPLSDSEAAQYVGMPVAQNQPPAALAGPMGVNQLPTLSQGQPNALNKLMNFYSGVSHEINDQGAGIRGMVQGMMGNTAGQAATQADRARQNDAFQISTGQDPSSNLGSNALLATEGGMGAMGAGRVLAPVGGYVMANPLKSLSIGYGLTHMNSVGGLLQMLQKLGAGGG